MRFRRPASGPVLTARHHIGRLQWAMHRHKMLMAEQGSGGGNANDMLMHASWKETHGEVEASWYGVESVNTKNLGMVSFRTSVLAEVMVLRLIATLTKL